MQIPRHAFAISTIGSLRWLQRCWYGELLISTLMDLAGVFAASFAGSLAGGFGASLTAGLGTGLGVSGVTGSCPTAAHASKRRSQGSERGRWKRRMRARSVGAARQTGNFLVLPGRISTMRP